MIDLNYNGRHELKKKLKRDVQFTIKSFLLNIIKIQLKNDLKSLQFLQCYLISYQKRNHCEHIEKMC